MEFKFAPGLGVKKARLLNSKEHDYYLTRNLCFFCPNQWTPGHKCSQSNKMHLCYEDLDEELVEDSTNEGKLQVEFNSSPVDTNSTIAGNENVEDSSILSQTKEGGETLNSDDNEKHGNEELQEKEYFTELDISLEEIRERSEEDLTEDDLLEKMVDYDDEYNTYQEVVDDEFVDSYDTSMDSGDDESNFSPEMEKLYNQSSGCKTSGIVFMQGQGYTSSLIGALLDYLRTGSDEDDQSIGKGILNTAKFVHCQCSYGLLDQVRKLYNTHNQHNGRLQQENIEEHQIMSSIKFEEYFIKLDTSAPLKSPAQELEWCQEYCNNFHAIIALKGGSPGKIHVLHFEDVGWNGGSFSAVREIQGKETDIPECLRIATTQYSWNAPEHFDLFVLEVPSFIGTIIFLFEFCKIGLNSTFQSNHQTSSIHYEEAEDVKFSLFTFKGNNDKQMCQVYQFLLGRISHFIWGWYYKDGEDFFEGSIEDFRIIATQCPQYGEHPGLGNRKMDKLSEHEEEAVLFKEVATSSHNDDHTHQLEVILQENEDKLFIVQEKEDDSFQNEISNQENQEDYGEDVLKEVLNKPFQVQMGIQDDFFADVSHNIDNKPMNIGDEQNSGSKYIIFQLQRELVWETASTVQEFTQSGGGKPFGSSLLIAKNDDKEIVQSMVSFTNCSTEQVGGVCVPLSAEFVKYAKGIKHGRLTAQDEDGDQIECSKFDKPNSRKLFGEAQKKDSSIAKQVVGAPLVAPTKIIFIIWGWYYKKIGVCFKEERSIGHNFIGGVLKDENIVAQSDSFDVEVQKIKVAIHQKGTEENWEAATEYNPEALAHVVMLCVDMEDNGVPLKPIIDSESIEEVYEIFEEILFITWNWYYKDLVDKRASTHPGNWMVVWIIAWK